MPTKDPFEPYYRITVQEAQEMLKGDNVALVDVREPSEYKAGHIPGATLIPVDTLYHRAHELPRDKEIIFVCAVGVRSALACEIAASAGLQALYNLEGGTEGWSNAGLPVEQ